MIGEGVYTLTEVSRIARIPLATVRAWFWPSRGEPLFSSDYPAIDGDYAVSFLNLIELHVARFFREAGVKHPILRRARCVLQEELKVSHPFAHADLCTDGNRIIRIIGDAGGQELVDVISKQQFFSQMGLRKITYHPHSQMAQSWGISTGVVINPRIGFGKPVIEGTGVSTLVVAKQYIANGKDASLVARLFRLKESGVINAFEFERDLGRVRVAA